ncbi:MAG: BCCT family transporter [Haloquadratum sp.]
MSTDDRTSIQEFREEIDPPVFWAGAIVSVLFIVAYVIAPQKAGAEKNLVAWAMTATNNWLWSNLAWYYLLAMLIFVGFAAFLMFGPWGKIKIGGEEAEPTHSFFTYFAMFFSAGIAAGIDFWGPAESIYHLGYGTPLSAGASNPSTQALMVDALVYSFFHWGISAWCAYLVVAVPVGYYAYNKGAPFRFSTLLAPFIGIDNIKTSNWAKLVDAIAVFATLGGVATSLGLVGQELVKGVEYVGDVSISPLWTFVIIAGVTILFTISVVSGIDKGIKRISQVNVGLFLVLGVATFLLGFPFFVLNIGTQALGTYLNQFLHLSLLTGTGSEATLSGIAGKGFTVGGFVGGWTVFYWAWWFSWAPFSGLFLARISKGRTIREMTFVGVVATTLSTIPWFMVLGATSMKLQVLGRVDILGAISQYGVAVSGYPLFGALPLGALWMSLFFILVVTFFVTSADSSTLSVAMLTTGGKQDPSGSNRLFWGVIQGIIAGLLVYIGGTNALQQAAIITGGPVAIVGLIGCWGLYRTLAREHGSIITQEGADIRGEEDSLLSAIGEAETGSVDTDASTDD